MTEETPKNPFKNSMGTRYLRGLFYETTDADKSSVVYTLKDQDHLGFVSLYRLYMAAADPLEYQFAVSSLDGWEHWEALCDCSWFKPYVERWRRELEIKIKSEALAGIILESRSSSTNAYHARKLLLEGPWKPADKTKAGRPTKVAIQQEAHRIASSAAREASDFERLSNLKAN